MQSSENHNKSKLGEYDSTVPYEPQEYQKGGDSRSCCQPLTPNKIETDIT